MKLVEMVLAGERAALARLITLVENDTDEGSEAVDELFPHTGKAHLVGITGAPGTGKSSLVNQLAYFFRNTSNGKIPKNIGIIAVDPTSPFSNGAFLGDRIRMRDLSGDSGVFIRSMATRGTLGGLAHKTASVAQVMDAAGFDMIIIETVGSGQSEIDIARLAHTVIVVEAPGLGDDIQTYKAGILEIADIIVVNKADLPGADHTEQWLKNMLGQTFTPSFEHMRLSKYASPDVQSKSWVPPVLKTVALTKSGIKELANKILQHAEYIKSNGEWQHREQIFIQNQFTDLLKNELLKRWETNINKKLLDSTIRQVIDHQISPHRAVENLIQKI